MAHYDFNRVYRRTDSEKWMEQQRKFGREGLVSLWEADMDFVSAEPIVQALVERAQQGIYGYVHKGAGYNEAIIEWTNRHHGFAIKEEWLLHAPMVMTAVLLFLREACAGGGGVVLPMPIYYPFFDVVKNAGAKAIHSPMIYENGEYRVDFGDLERCFKAGAKVFVLCNPHNPGGMVWSRANLEKLGALCLRYGVKVIADEAHADFVWSGVHVPFASISPELADISLTLYSPGKTFNLAGTHQAVVVAPNPDIRATLAAGLGMLDIEKNNCFSLVAVEAGYRHGEDWLRQVSDYILANMDYTIDFCKSRMPAIKARRPQGTYLMWLDCRDLGLDGEALEDFMVHKAGVGLCEGRWFGPEGDGFERLNVACPRDTLEAGLMRIEAAVRTGF